MINLYGVNILNKSIQHKENIYRKRLELLMEVCCNHGELIDPDFLSINFYQTCPGDDVDEVQKVTNTEEGRCQAYIDYLSDVALVHKSKWTSQDWALLSLFDATYRNSEEDYPIIYKSKPCKDCNVGDVEETRYKIIRNRTGGYERVE
jgi:hypothetical protein